MRGFYSGSYFVKEFPTPVKQNWLFPNNLEHTRETSNVEELHINPEDMVLFPEEVQAGHCQYTRITFSTIPDFYLDGLDVDLGFYFTLFADSGFYFTDLPGLGGFYVNYDNIVDFYNAVAPGLGGFYVNYDNIDDFYNAVAPGLGGFYISNDMDTDGFYIVLVGN